MKKTGCSIVFVKSRQTGTIVKERLTGVLAARLSALPFAGLILKWILFKVSLPTRIIGWLADRRFSRKMIPAFIRRHGIDSDRFEQPPDGYPSFNEFFIRRLAPDVASCLNITTAPGLVVAPADGRLMVYPRINWDGAVTVKNSVISPLLLTGARGRGFLADYEALSMFVIRLSPSDYHRFHFPFAGRLHDQWEIPGEYLPVHPAALSLFDRVHVVNRRYVSCLEGKFGRCLQVEVGAFGVSRIEQTFTGAEFSAVMEKGFFRLGASTVILLMPSLGLIVDHDLLNNSVADIETMVAVGEQLGIVTSSL